MVLDRRRFMSLGSATLAGFIVPGCATSGDLVREIERRLHNKVRMAVVAIGTTEYEHFDDLPNAFLDAQLIANVFRSMPNCRVILLLNKRRAELLNDLESWRLEEAGAGIVVPYVSGHGFEVGGEQFIAVNDSSATSAEALRGSAVSLDAIDAIVRSVSGTQVCFYDVCRTTVRNRRVEIDGPLSPGAVRSIIPKRRLAQPNSIEFWSTSRRQSASDGEPGRHSPFARVLAEHLAMKNVDVRDLADRVTRDVYRLTAGNQRPWYHASLIGGSFVLNPRS